MAALLVALFAPLVTAQMNVGNRIDILRSADVLAGDIDSLYDGGVDVPGRLDDESYYYSQGGDLMATYIDYWHLTNDSSYNDAVAEAIIAQRDDGNFLPYNLRPTSITNEDQCVWGLTAMLAAEDELPEPEGTSWFAVARGVYDEQKGRLDLEGEDECNGGMRWGINSSHHGWQWKSTATNACLFDLSARLARYSQNETYADTAVELWDWMRGINLIEDSWTVNSGSSFERSTNCSETSAIQESLSSLLLTQGAAFMYNYTNGTDEWHERLEGLMQTSLENFFPEGVSFEPDCEVQSQCDIDELGWRGVNVRSLAVVSKLAPFTRDSVYKTLRATAEAAADSCVGGKCGTYWYVPDEDDEERGDLIRQMNALSAIANLLVEEAAAPVVRPPSPPEDDGNEEGGDGGDGGDAGDGSSGSSGDDNDSDDNEGAGRSLFSDLSMLLLVVGLASSWLGSGL